MGEIHGFCDERFAPLEALFRENQETGMDEGASLAVMHGEVPVVDLWAGTTDYERAEPWEEDTLVTVFSTSKVMVNIAVLMVYDRGLVDLRAPIADVWPEFAANGKERITTHDVLTHRSGLPGFGQPVGWKEIHDWERMIEVLERAEPWHEPGARSYYHPHTYGFLLGEIVSRVSGLVFAEFFRREIAEPLGADFHFGLTDPHDQARVAQLWYPEVLPEAILDPVMIELENGPWVQPERMAAVMPSANGISNARAMARIGAIMATGGELGGTRYLSESVVREAATEQSFDSDPILGPLRVGLGFGLHSDGFPAPSQTTVHWGGFGGSFVTMDTATGVSVGFAPNRLLLDEAPAGEHMAEERLTRLFETIGRVQAALG